MKLVVAFLAVALLGGCVTGPEETVDPKETTGTEKDFHQVRIDFQYGFDATQTVFEVDGESVFEKTLTTCDILSVADVAEISLSEGVHTLYCSVDGAGYDTTVAVSDSLVIGVYRSFDDGSVHFTVYFPGNFPAYD